MNKHLPSLLPALSTLILLISAAEADAQCRRFARQRVISTLNADQTLGQITSGVMSRGESASTVLEIEDAGIVDLILSTHRELGSVSYSVTDARGNQYSTGQVQGPQERISIDVQADTDLIVHIQSERTTNAYIPLGCVALATARSIDSAHEYNLLAKE